MYTANWPRFAVESKIIDINDFSRTASYPSIICNVRNFSSKSYGDIRPFVTVDPISFNVTAWTSPKVQVAFMEPSCSDDMNQSKNAIFFTAFDRLVKVALKRDGHPPLISPYQTFIWNTKTGESLTSYNGIPGKLLGLSQISVLQKEHLFLFGDKIVWLDVLSAKSAEESVFESPSPIISAELLGNRIFAIHEDYKLRIWNVQDKRYFEPSETLYRNKEIVVRNQHIFVVKPDTYAFRSGQDLGKAHLRIRKMEHANRFQRLTAIDPNSGREIFTLKAGKNGVILLKFLPINYERALLLR